MQKKIFITLLSTIISSAALYFALRNVPFSDLATYISSINYLWLIPFVMLSALGLIIRVYRWKVILGNNYQLTFWQAYHPLIISFTSNLILPGRIGELVRPALLKKKGNIPFSTGLASVVAERLFDLVFLLFLFIFTGFFIDIDPNLNIAFGQYSLNKATLESIRNSMILMSILLVGFILLVSTDLTRDLLKKCIRKIPRIIFFLPTPTEKKLDHLCDNIIKIIDNIASGFLFIKSPKPFCLCLGLSSIIWSLQVISYYVMAQGCPGIDLSLIEYAAVITIICFFIALPSVPGFWGVWEAGGVFAFSLFGVAEKDAAGYTLTNHTLQVLPLIVAGLISAYIYGISIKGVRQEAQTKSTEEFIT